VALGLVESLREQVAAGGYTALGVLIAVENVLPPIPSEVVLPLAGFYVSEGTLALVPAIAAATAGSLVGAWVLYALGRFGGRRLVLRFHRVLRVSEQQLDRADDWFDRYDWALVLFGRMVPGMRSVVSIPAGMAEMPLWQFTLMTVIGSAVWNTALIAAGRELGENWEKVAVVVGSLSTVVVVGVIVAVVAAAAVWWVRRRRRP
jgi:membrane protein DedA with SNARE-associated domain